MKPQRRFRCESPEPRRLSVGEGTIDPGFHVEHSLIAGDRLVMFGTRWTWPETEASPLPTIDGSYQIDSLQSIVGESETLIATVKLGGDRTIIQQTLPGSVKDLHPEGDRLVMVMHSTQPMTARFRLPEVYETVYSFEITDHGLRQLASRQIDPGATMVRGDTLLSVSAGQQPTQHLVRLDADASLTAGHSLITRYQIGTESIDQLASIDLGSGWIDNLQLVDPFKATAVRSDQSPDAAVVTAVDLLDLSGDTLRLFETVTVADFAGSAVVIEPDFVLLYDEATPESLVLVDTDTRTGPETGNRIRHIDVDPGLMLQHGGLRLSDNQIIVIAARQADTDPVDQLRDFASGQRPAAESVLLTISLDEAKIKAAKVRLGRSSPPG